MRATATGARVSDPRQHWDPERYARNARFVSDLGMPVVELLAPRAGERILDLGCGDGALTVKLAEIGCDVVAVDASAEQVAAARARGLDARVARAEALPFDAELDGVLSNAVLHWVKDAGAALASVYRALRPGGRFAAELGGFGCVERIRSALHEALERRGRRAADFDPWYFPTDQEYRAHLEHAGFEVRSIALIPRPTPLPGDVTGWLETFANPFLAAVDAAEQPAFLAEVRERLRPQLCDAEGRWTADYVRLRLLATKPAR
jgi:trans-aconitate methyltransferase